MKDMQPSDEGMLGRPPPVEPDPSRSGEPKEPGAYIFCLAVRASDPSVQDAPKNARVRITPAFARWALQMRLLVERGASHALVYEDARPTWLSYASADACGDDDDEDFARPLAPTCIHVSREGVAWRSVLCPGEVHIETEPLCFEELTELVLRAAARSSPRGGELIHIAECIPVALSAATASAAAARRGLHALLHKTQRIWPVKSQARAPGPHKEVE